jgi:hypothetical protein
MTHELQPYSAPITTRFAVRRSVRPPPSLRVWDGDIHGGSSSPAGQAQLGPDKVLKSRKRVEAQDRARQKAFFDETIVWPLSRVRTLPRTRRTGSLSVRSKNKTKEG